MQDAPVGRLTGDAVKTTTACLDASPEARLES
jgi:hypothetical protein